MSLFSSTLCWCFLQITALSIIALVLGSRPWRLGGRMLPLFGLIGVGLISATAFIPLPWTWQISALDLPFSQRSSETYDAQPSGVIPTEIDGAKTAEQSQSTVGQLDQTSVFVSGFLEGLRQPNSSKSGWPQNSVSLAILVLFGTGFVVGAARLIMGLIATSQLIRSGARINSQPVEELMVILLARLGLNRSIEVYETERLSTAATVGAWRPRILLPSHWRDWNETELNAVLAHELAHIAHGDFAAVLISQLSLVIHFYHPLVHWLAGRLRLEQELAADAVAAQLVGGERSYLNVLAKLALEHQDRFVGWPARAFLPTRQTFLRRLEMLRDGNGCSPRVSRGRWLATIAVGAAFVALVSLKPPGVSAETLEPNAQTDSKITAGFDLKYFCDSGGMVIAAKPAELMANKQLAQIAEELQQQEFIAFGIALADIEQVIVNIESSPQPYAAYLRSSKSLDKIELPPNARPGKLAGADIYELPGDNCIWKPDNQSLVFGSLRNVERFIQGRQVERKLTESELWKSLSDRPLVVIGEGKRARNWLRPGSPFYSTMVSPIVQELENFGLAVSIGKEISLTAVAQSIDEKGAATIRETGQAALVLAKNGLRELKLPSQPSGMEKMLVNLQSVGSKLVDNSRWQLDGTKVRLSTSIPVEAELLDSLASLSTASRRASERLQSANQLKQLALAFHIFHDTYNQFPHPTLSPNPEHKHPVSWRVLILPYIEHDALYKQYRFDEPWDGPNNSKLLAKMPAVYRHPDVAANSTETNYVVLNGDETIFDPKKKARISDILDGTSNTIMIVETKTSIPWTKPEDINYSKDKPLPEFGGFSPEGFQVAFADGHVRFLGKSIEERLLRALYTAKGGEVIDGSAVLGDK